MSEKMLALSDIDGTVTKNPAIMIRMIEVQLKTGTLRPGYFEKIHEHFGNYHDGRLAYEDFATGLVDQYAQALKGAQFSVVLTEVRQAIDDKTIPLFANTSSILQQLQADHDLYFVTASPQFIAQAISERFIPAKFLSSVLEVEKGVLTGRVSLSLATRGAKQAAISEIIKKYPYSGSVALGDSIGDLTMLEAAETKICISPETHLKQVALERGYKILEGN